jgi:putative SOS response-associated peptidase YedK
MCGRFALFTLSEELVRQFGAEPPPDWIPRYNVAPTSRIPIVREVAGGRQFALARWGLVPAWAKDIDTGYSTINARAETVAEKPAFRAAFKHRRCLIPADGWYEWRAIPGSKAKQPYFIARRDRSPLALAGLWERWEGRDREPLESCTIIVTAANDGLRGIHDRMPVVLDPASWDDWLALEQRDPAVLQGLLRPAPDGELTAWPVSTHVSNARNEGPECLEPTGSEWQPEESPDE